MSDETSSFEDTTSGFYANRFKPARIPDAEMFDRGTDAGADARYVLLRPGSEEAVLLSADDKIIWEMIDGVRSVKDICSEYLERYRRLALTRVFTLLYRLGNAGFLVERPIITPEQVTFGPGPIRIVLVDWLRLRVPGSDVIAKLLAPLVRTLRLDSRGTQVLLGLIAIVGFVLAGNVKASGPFLRLWYEHQMGPLVIRPGYINGIILVLLLHLAASLLRQLWMLAVEGAMIGRYAPLQFVFSYGLPCFRHPGKWRVALPFDQRLAAVSAGVTFELVLAAFLALAAAVTNAPGLRELLYKGLWVLYLRSFMHLSPLAASDLYRLMTDWSSLQRFRHRALGFLRHGFIDALFGNFELNREQRFLLLYNLVSVVWLLLATLFAVDAIIANQQMLRDLSFQMARGASTVILLGVLAIPIVTCLGLGLFWGGFVLRGWGARQAFSRRAGSLIATCLGTLLVIGVILWLLSATGAMTGVQLRGALRLLALIMAAAAAIQLFRLLPRIGGARGIQLIILAAATTACALGILCEYLLPSQSNLPAQLNWIAVAAAALWLLFSLTRGPGLRSFAGSMLLPVEIALVSGAAGVIIALAARPHSSAELIAGNSAALLLYLGAGALLTGTVVCGQRLAAPLPRIGRLSPGKATDAGGLIKVFAFVTTNIGKMISQHLGRGTATTIERIVQQAAAPRPFSFDDTYLPERSELGPLASECRALLTTIDRGLQREFGLAVADRLWQSVFSKCPWESNLLLDQHLLPETRWADWLKPELALSREERVRLIDSLTIFDDFDATDKEQLLQSLDYQQFDAGALVVRQGEFGEVCYMVSDGSLQVEQVDLSGEHQIIAFLRPGDFFGEAALLERTPRMADIRVIRPAKLLALHKDDFARLRQTSPQTAQRLTDRLTTFQLLLHVPLFADLPKGLLRSILPDIRAAKYAKGDDIVRQGDVGDNFYLIKSGTVQVIAVTETAEVPVCELVNRDFFGEIALLRNVPRTATVRARVDTEVLELKKADFVRLVAHSEMFAANLRSTGDERLKELLGLV